MQMATKPELRLIRSRRSGARGCVLADRSTDGRADRRRGWAGLVLHRRPPALDHYVVGDRGERRQRSGQLRADLRASGF